MSKPLFPPLIAHRGASLYAPENTLAALKKAAELGATWVECDVRLAACGTPIIFHDASLERTTEGHGEVLQHSYEAIAHLDAGSWFAPEFKAERVPSLEAWLSCAASLGLGLNLEMKSSASEAEFAAQQLIQAIKKHWPLDYSKLLISSFTPENVYAVHRLESSLPIGFLYKTWSEAHWSTIKELGCVSVHISQRHLDAVDFEAFKQRSLSILVYTVDDFNLAQQLFKHGVSGIFSNDPALLDAASTGHLPNAD